MMEKLYKFIDFLENTKSQIISQEQLFNELSKLVRERAGLKRKGEVRADDVKRENIQANIESNVSKFTLYDDFCREFEGLRMSGALNPCGIKKEITTDAEADKMLCYIQKYIDFRQKTKSLTEIYFQNNFRNVDEVLKEIYFYINGEDRGDFDDFYKSYSAQISQPQTYQQPHIPDNLLILLQQYGYIKDATAKPLMWIKPNSRAGAGSINKAALIDLLSQLGYPDEVIGNLKLLNEHFVFANGYPIKSNNLSDLRDSKQRFIHPIQSEYHNELKMIIEKSKGK